MDEDWSLATTVLDEVEEDAPQRANGFTVTFDNSISERGPITLAEVGPNIDVSEHTGDRSYPGNNERNPQ
eukprot:3516762-Karenia_brevis.AAC.1